MRDIAPAAQCFGAYYGPPMHERWLFRADVNWDHKINMRDIAPMAQNFGKSCP